MTLMSPLMSLSAVHVNLFYRIVSYRIKRFLLQTEIITAASERTYKLSRPYQLKQFVNALQVCSVPSFHVIRARCLPSLSTDKDDVKLMHIVIDKHTGQPFGGYCTCTVGCVYFITLL